MRSERRTTANTTSTVTIRTSKSWNSFHAAVYHEVVQPSGSQVPSQRRANELVATAAIMRPMLTTNSVIRPSKNPFHARSAQAFIASSSSLPARDRAAVEEIAQAEHGGND